MLSSLRGPAASIIYKWTSKSWLLQDILFQKQVFFYKYSSNRLPVISSLPQSRTSVPAHLPPAVSPGRSTNHRGSGRAAGGHCSEIWILPQSSQISLTHKPHSSCLLSSGPGEELKECPSEPGMSLSGLARGVLALQWPGCGGGEMFCFLLEMTCLARHKPFDCSKGDLPPFGGQRGTWPALFEKLKHFQHHILPQIKSETRVMIQGLTWMSTRPFLRCPRHPQVSATMAVVDLFSHWCSIHSFRHWLYIWHSVCQALHSHTGERSMGGTQFHILQFHFHLAWRGERKKERTGWNLLKGFY